MRTSLLLVALWLGGPDAASTAARECVSLGWSTAEVFSFSALVFVGDVTEVVAEYDGHDVTFNVLEAYKGIQPGEQTVRFGFSPEAFPFKTDQRVLVWAMGAGERYSSACTDTRVITLTDRGLNELRSLARHRP